MLPTLNRNKSASNSAAGHGNDDEDFARAPPPLPSDLTEAIKQGFKLAAPRAPTGTAAASSSDGARTSRQSLPDGMYKGKMIIDLDIEPDVLSQGRTTRSQQSRDLDNPQKEGNIVRYEVNMELHLRMTEEAKKYYEKTDNEELQQAVHDSIKSLFAKKKIPKAF